MLYFTADYSRVFALDARTGTCAGPGSPNTRTLEAVLCCGPVNRGLAIQGDLVFVGTLDARLVALNRKDGSVAWQQKIEDWQNGLYVDRRAAGRRRPRDRRRSAAASTACAASSRPSRPRPASRVWKTYMIPGPGEPGNETWPGDTWKTGGGPPGRPAPTTPRPTRCFWGTGNPGPWNSDLRKGDNKWSCSLVAMDADTGKIKWAFQYTPNDAWDYDGNNAPTLLDVTIDGKPRKVAVQSNRNGFLYVLDRDQRRVHLCRCRPIEGINWTTGLDPTTGTADDQRGQAAEERRPQGRAHRSRARRRHQLVPDGLRSREGIVYFDTNDWAMSLTRRGSPRTSSTMPGDVYMGVDYQMYRHEARPAT